MSRYARRTDTTHGPIRDALRAIGCSVIDAARLGNDAPDLIVGFRGRTLLVECKTSWNKSGTVEPKRTTDGQKRLLTLWAGDAIIHTASAEDAVRQVQYVASGEWSPLTVDRPQKATRADVRRARVANSGKMVSHETIGGG